MNYVLNIITLVVSTIFCLLIVNVIFINISNQKYFPRALANSLPNILLTFYPNTYSKENLKVYNAIAPKNWSNPFDGGYLTHSYNTPTTEKK